MKIQFIWEDQKIRNLARMQLIIDIAGSTIASLYGVFLPLSTPYRPLIIFVPITTIIVCSINLLFINAKNPGWHFLITNLWIELAAVFFMGITGGFSSPLQYAPYALLLIALFQLGPDAAVVLGTWSVITFAGLFVWQFHHALSAHAALDFFVYTVPYVLFVIIGRNIGVELSLQFEARKKLEQIDDLKNQFITLTSHYLRTPLTAIKYFVEELGEEKQSVEDKQQFERLNVSVGQLEMLVEKMLLISSIERGRTNLILARADVSEVLQSVISSMRAAAAEKNITLVLHAEQPSITGTFDRDKIVLVLRGLIDNAIKFSNRGSEVDIFTGIHGDNLYIRVADYGAGIKKEAMEALFSSFNKGGMDEALHLEKPGPGLSLYLAKLIAEAHGGKISAVSKEGAGTEFMLMLPVSRR